MATMAKASTYSTIYECVKALKENDYYIAVYPTSLNSNKDSYYIALGNVSKAAAVKAFRQEITGLMDRHPRRSKMRVHLMRKTAPRKTVQGFTIETEPVAQWNQRPNPNFDWPTGPSHYFDAESVHKRSRQRVRRHSLFIPSDYKPVAS